MAARKGTHALRKFPHSRQESRAAGAGPLHPLLCGPQPREGWPQGEGFGPVPTPLPHPSRPAPPQTLQENVRDETKVPPSLRSFPVTPAASFSSVPSRSLPAVACARHCPLAATAHLAGEPQGLLCGGFSTLPPPPHRLQSSPTPESPAHRRIRAHGTPLHWPAPEPGSQRAPQPGPPPSPVVLRGAVLPLQPIGGNWGPAWPDPLLSHHKPKTLIF